MTPNDPITTTNAGAPAPSDNNSLTQGPVGPILLHDHYLLEKLAQFNRERVPERVVHAKGSGAFGELVVEHDISSYTKADFLQPGKRTEMLARFSTVAGEQGSPDTWRDPRGFSLKFYTEEGNYDLVGNNTPVFFIQDPIKFPDFIRSQKRLPGSGLRDNNMQWDFWTLRPESAHQVTWLMGDRGIPRTYRHMDGFGSHTYQFVNAAGERSWVKFHFKTNQGAQFLTQDEADKIAGESPDFHRADLYDHIAEGDFPSWSFEIQIMPYEDAWTYKYNPFDLTKVWSQQDYPRIKVGTLTLNRNPENFFAQIEQASFEPSNFVPGIETSPDKMLLGRIFSYADAHRYRIGANYADLPVNQPKNQRNSYSKEGAMRYSFNSSETPVYAPNSYGGPHADEERYGNPAAWDSSGPQARTVTVKHEADGDFVQPGILVREVMDDDARERLVGNIAGHASNGVTPEVLGRVFQYWTNVDAELGKRVEEATLALVAQHEPATGAGSVPEGDQAARE